MKAQGACLSLSGLLWHSTVVWVACERDICFSRCWRLRSPRSGCWQIRLLARTAFYFIDRVFLCFCRILLMAEGGQSTLWVSSVKVPIPFIRVPLSWPNHPQESHLWTSSPWGLGFDRWVCRRQTHSVHIKPRGSFLRQKRELPACLGPDCSSPHPPPFHFLCLSSQEKGIGIY